MSRMEQAHEHHRLFFKLFKPGYNPAEIHKWMPRLLGFIERQIPIFYPTTFRDITQPSLRKFFHDEWRSGAEEDLGILLKAYVSAGFISLEDTNFSRDGLEPNMKPCGTVLQLALQLKWQWAPSIVNALLESGANLDNVPFTDMPGVKRTYLGESLVTDVSKGDILGFAAAIHGPGGVYESMLKKAIMHKVVSAGSAVSAIAMELQTAGCTTRLRRSGI